MNDVQSLSGLDRRTVVRAGVAAAWAVPLVQTVAAAPAFAVSGPARVEPSGTITQTSRSYAVNSNVANNGGSATQGLVATVTAATRTGGPVPITTVTSPPSGWTGAGGVWTSVGQLGPGASKPFNITFTIDLPPGHVKSVTVTFTSVGGVSGVLSNTDF